MQQIDYLEKFNKLVKDGWLIDDIVKNFYLNYSAFDNNEEVYNIKKKICECYDCRFRDVQLIGSSRTGFTIEEYTGQLIKRDNPEDYDFCIISARLFSKFLYRIDFGKLEKRANYELIKNLKIGKIHHYYINKELQKELKSMCDKLGLELKIKKEISICFYLSEDFFIKGLVNYFKKVYAKILRGESKKGLSINTNTNSDINILNDLKE